MKEEIEICWRDLPEGKVRREYSAPNPVTQYDTGWYFWDETWTRVMGPFSTERYAAIGASMYSISELDPKPITSFKGDRMFRFLSNFWLVEVAWEGERYPSVEHAYQAAKTTDPKWRRKLACGTVYSCADAKRVGKRLPLREGWDAVKLSIMENLLRQKFGRFSKDLNMLLRLTGDLYLVEGNDWGDRFWGMVDGIGENHLGKLLMAIRKDAQTAATKEGHKIAVGAALWDRPRSMAELELKPPGMLFADEARVAAQNLLDEGKIKLDDRLKLARTDR